MTITVLLDSQWNPVIRLQPQAMTCAGKQCCSLLSLTKNTGTSVLLQSDTPQTPLSLNNKGLVMSQEIVKSGTNQMLLGPVFSPFCDVLSTQENSHQISIPVLSFTTKHRVTSGPEPRPEGSWSLFLRTRLNTSARKNIMMPSGISSSRQGLRVGQHRPPPPESSPTLYGTGEALEKESCLLFQESLVQVPCEFPGTHVCVCVCVEPRQPNWRS